MRKLLILLCLLGFVFSAPASAWAQGAVQQQKQQQDSEHENAGSSGIIGKQVDAYYDNPDNQPGLLERSISDVLIGSANFLIQFFGMKDVTLLVFGKNPNPTGDGFLQGGSSETPDSLYLGVFTEGMMSAIDALYGTFERFMPFPLVLAVLLLAALMLWNSTSSENRSKSKDYLTAFLVGLLSIRFGYYLWTFVAYLSRKFTDLIWAAMVDNGVEPNLFLNMIWGNGAEGYGQMIEYRGFVVAVLVLLAAVMMATLNYQYTLRMIMLMILVSTFVVSAVLTIFPKFRHSLQTWWDLFLSYMLMPCAHAVALGLFFLLLRYSSDGVSNWIIVAYLFGFSSIQGLVSKLLGGEEAGKRSGFGSMLGAGSMMALGRMFRPKGSSGGFGKSKKGQSQDIGMDRGGLQEGEMAAGTSLPSGNITPAASGAAGTAPVSWKRKAVQTGGRVAGFALNYGAKVAGATAGTSIGLMAGNPLMGAAVGAKVGGWAGKGAESLAKGGFWLGNKAVQGIQQMRDSSVSAQAEPMEMDVAVPMSGGERVNSTTFHGLSGQMNTGGEAGFALSGGQLATNAPTVAGAAPSVSSVNMIAPHSDTSVQSGNVTNRREGLNRQEGISPSLTQVVHSAGASSSPQSVLTSEPSKTIAERKAGPSRVKMIMENIRSSQQMVSNTGSNGTENVREEQIQVREQLQSSNSQNDSSRKPVLPVMSHSEQNQQADMPSSELPPQRSGTRHYNYDL
ncbi:hypothetical protein ASL14_19005 [Paenibacillus sp. IHB B 3084]|uniref:DUF1269 domain-containing protein n=1 Tax=Paenibacillus sp. IHB B 3084 TaxID=867076 RepID=UPI00072055A8|nr:DUF1269 domain-containing protein [Paenibacillus sp. IHB B 3084]ALP37962.1 hypothetical protein ASL14_19005 [Paenibacillus sp. IHB B 3084]